MKNYNLGEVINFLVENNLWGKQCFNSKGIAGDPMEHMYNKDGVVIDMCWHYDYFEIFGITDEDFEVIESPHNARSLAIHYELELRRMKQNLAALEYAINKEKDNPELNVHGISVLISMIRDAGWFSYDWEIPNWITKGISSLTREELDDAVNKYSKKMDKEDEE